jgi:hypothetical protein
LPILEHFDTPGRVHESDEDVRAGWSEDVASIFARFAARFEQVYDPTQTDTPEGIEPTAIAWVAFPARLLRGATSEQQRWSAADNERDEQDEYCEWAVERDPDGKLERVTLTTEVGEYYKHLAERDPDLLLDLYRRNVDERVRLDELIVGGRYQPANRWNRSSVGRPAHLKQKNNNLGAAVALVAEATVPRETGGVAVTTKQELAQCAGLGNQFRNSDPQIAAIVNGAARTGAEVTLGDPPGLYIDELNTAAIQTPDNEDPLSFWTIERGSPEYALRASFHVPPERGYKTGDITVAGRPLQFGAQLADRVVIRVSGLVKPGQHRQAPVPCKQTDA